MSSQVPSRFLERDKKGQNFNILQNATEKGMNFILFYTFKVTGVVQTSKEIIRYVINGYWDKSIEYQEVKEQKLVDGKSDPSLKLITRYGNTKRIWTRGALP